MIDFKKHKLTLITIAYWFLLLYIIAALLWWFIALQNQVDNLTATRLSEINKDDVLFQQKTAEILAIQKRKTAQYIGEGVSFLLVILIGAAFIYRSIRRQIKFAQQQQNFLMAITHELKTPIAAAQLNIQTLQKRKLETTQQTEVLDAAMFEMNRLNYLSNNILWAAQLESGNFKKADEQINYSNVVKNCIINFQKNYQSQKIISHILDDIFIYGDVLMLEMLVNNLIDNAIKYSNKNEVVEIILNKDVQTILQVKDAGIGISETEKKKVFDKFYRIGNESTRTTKGTGLGLYLCKKICNYHKANISIKNNTPKGSIFMVTFNH